MSNLPARWNALIVGLALVTLVGCQGFSSGNSSQGTPPPAGALSNKPATVKFGNVQVGTVQAQTSYLTNTGAASLTVTQATVTGSGYSTGLRLPFTVSAGQSIPFNIIFSPHTTGTLTGNLALAYSESSNPLNIALAGNAVAAGNLTASPTSISFGTVQVGVPQTQNETLTNTGSDSLTISGATFSVPGFSYTGLTLPLTLAPNQSATFGVVFTPTSAGAVNSLLSFTISGSTVTVDVALSGTGAAPPTLTASPASFTFSNVIVGQNQTQTETVKNTGGMNAVISQATVAGTGFSISGLSAPLTLTPGQSTSFSVTFAPQSAGSASGNVVVDSNATDPALSVALAGTAVTAGVLTGSPTSFSFGNVQDGTNQSQTETLKNTGGENLTISQATISGAGFSYTGLTLPLTLAPNQSSTFAVVFAPTTPGAVSGSLVITATGTSPLSLALSGTGVAPATLTASPTSLTFSNVTVGQNQTQTETVKNTGGENATISQVTVAGTGFSFSGITTPLTLTPGQSTSFNVTFAPLSAGSSSGSVMIDSDATDPALSVPLSGTAVAQSQGILSVSAVNVGSVVVGTSGTQTGTLSATGASVSVTSASLSGANPSEFSISGLTFPVTVTTTQPVTFTVKFTPTSTGAASASASFVSTAANTPTAGALSGTGTPAPVHTVNLSWTPSVTTGITSYNIYRAVLTSGVCGTYSNVGSTGPSVTTFTDNGPLTDGWTYCYATTAVDPSGESAYSNIAQAPIPAP